MFSRLKWALIFLILALLTLPMCFISSFMRQKPVSDHLLRTPGSVTFEVREPGDFNLVFLRYQWVNDRYVNYPVNIPKGMTFKLSRMSDNSAVPIRILPTQPANPAASQSSQNMPASDTHTFANTRIDQKGYYQLEARGSIDTRLVKLTRLDVGKVLFGCVAYPCFFFIFMSLAILFWSLALVSRRKKVQADPYNEVFDKSEHL